MNEDVYFSDFTTPVSAVLFRNINATIDFEMDFGGKKVWSRLRNRSPDGDVVVSGRRPITIR